MLRAVSSKAFKPSVRSTLGGLHQSVASIHSPPVWIPTATGGLVDLNQETTHEAEARFLKYFKRTDLDGWEMRRAMMEVNDYDFIPCPELVSDIMRGCRRLNDYAIAVRYLETLKHRVRGSEKIYYWIIDQIRPVLNELGISTPDDMGYGEPELYHPNNDYWDWKNFPEGGNFDFNPHNPEWRKKIDAAYEMCPGYGEH